MDSDYKLFIWILALFLIIPLLGIGIDHWHKNQCRLELARTGWYTPAEINEVCK